MPCLLAPAEIPAFHADADLSRCGWVRLEMAGRAGLTLPDVGVSRSLSLPRAHVSGGIALGEVAAARVQVAAVRSGGETGYVGVDGEALVPEIQVAEARVAWTRVGLGAGAGAIDDPWVVTGDAAWGMRSVAPGFGELAGWFERADVGGWLAWGAPGGGLGVRVDLTSGEGIRERERNEGKDLAVTTTVRPLTDHDALVVTAFGRDGSRGLGLARDHRLGVRAAAHLGAWDTGLEGLAAWGVAGDAERHPVAGSAWLVARPHGPFLTYARVDVGSEALGEAGAGTLGGFVGAGVALPSPDRPVELLVGYEGTHVGARVAEIAGTDVDDAHTVFVQLGVDLTSERRGIADEPSRNAAGADTLAR